MRCAGGGPVKYGGIRELTEFQTNLKMNCIPDTDLDVEHYQEFRQARRKLMAQKTHQYYLAL